MPVSSSFLRTSRIAGHLCHAKTLFTDSHSTTILEKADDQQVGSDVTRLSSSRFKETLIPTEHYCRGRFNFFIALAPLWPLAAKAFAASASSREFLITKCGAVVDGSALDTKAIRPSLISWASKRGRHCGGSQGRLRLGRSLLQTKGGVLTCGSEATVVRDVIAEDCKITGAVRIATLKLRPDSPQHYEDITFRNITSEDPSSDIINMAPWSQYFDLQGMEPPRSIVKNLRIIGITGTFNSFGTIKPNPGQTDISHVLLKDFDVAIKNDKLNTSGVTDLKLENVIVNGKPYTP